MMNLNEENNSPEGGMNITPAVNAWLNEPEKVKALKDLKTIALGNARLLYGSDRNRFFDVVTFCNETQPQNPYAAVLVCTIDGTTKPLRKEIADCPLNATRAIVASLQNDTGILFTRNDVGDKLCGQQGARNSQGIFELFDHHKANQGTVDDTRDMERVYAPRGPGSGYDRGGSKRSKLDY